ncbi:MAG: hypothetical protein LBH25_11515 [Fibromonadaceae bacterium]|jgi:hypothetical protein|nr:hypothetical protein [Fibromonadaceae bacterium]
MPFKMLIILFFLACALLGACSGDNSNPTYPIEKTILDVSIVKRCANCYLLRWQHPYERKDLQSYYMWVDTTVVNDSVQKPSQSQVDRAGEAIPYSGIGEGDSLDLTNLISGFLERDSLHIAIWAKYKGGEQGMIRHYYVHFGDDVPPSMVSFSDSTAADTIWINWIRPTDQEDFYYPEKRNGPIAGYNVTIDALGGENIEKANVKAYFKGKATDASKVKKNQSFERDGRKTILKAVNTSSKTLRFAIEDGEGFDISDSDKTNDNNSWQLIISGLYLSKSYKISITAWDIAGNSSSTESRNVRTTDGVEPSIASEFWFYLDDNNKPRLDSNRLILFWKRSIGAETYVVKENNKAIPRIYAITSDYYNVFYRLQNGSMIADNSGAYVSDTLRWVSPGEKISLNLRAVNSSGHYSKSLDSVFTVSEGEFWRACPLDFMPVKKKDDSIFCMEKMQHAVGNEFEKNILYIEAKQACENLSDASFSVKLCTEQEWNDACNSGGSSYGVIEEKDFLPSEFLYSYCGVGTGNSASASFVDKRNALCKSPDGIRDLPGQLQEWVIGKDNSGNEIPLLKGTSYVKFEGASGVELAQCKNRFKPTRIRPKYTTDSVYLYRSGSRTDTLLLMDSLRQIYTVLPPSEFTDTLLFYSLFSKNGIPRGTDYVDQKEYRRRQGDEYLKYLWEGLSFTLQEKRQVLILGTESIDASNFFLDPTVGFRCCANGK